MPTLLPFNVWRQRLREDCARCNKLLAVHALEDVHLRLVWEAGTEPSVQGVIDGGTKADSELTSLLCVERAGTGGGDADDP